MVAEPAPGAIDVHGHCVPTAFLAELRRSRALGAEVDRHAGAWVVTPPGLVPLRPIAGVMTDAADRAGWLTAQSVCHQVVAPWLDLQVQALPAGAGRDWTRSLNDAMATMVADSRQLSAHASLHLADPQAAADELARAVTALGMRCAMVPTSLPAGRLSDRGFDALWAAAVGLGVPLLLHATTESPANRLLAEYPALHGLFGRYVDATLVAAELIVTGVLDRFPDLELIVAHGGAFLPYQLGRFDQDAVRPPGARLPSEVVRSLRFDTTLMTSRALRLLLDLVGAERLLIGSDYGATADPHDDVQVTQPIRESGAAPEQVAAVVRGNAERLLASLPRTA